MHSKYPLFESMHFTEIHIQKGKKKISPPSVESHEVGFDSNILQHLQITAHKNMLTEISSES